MQVIGHTLSNPIPVQLAHLCSCLVSFFIFELYISFKNYLADSACSHRSYTADDCFCHQLEAASSSIAWHLSVVVLFVFFLILHALRFLLIFSSKPTMNTAIHVYFIVALCLCIIHICCSYLSFLYSNWVADGLCMYVCVTLFHCCFSSFTSFRSVFFSFTNEKFGFLSLMLPAR